ncbi:MAG TPA: type II secretion system protein N, partial [Bordetella sp.]|nr:type II secretion system protein N [Bordetella sp.]
LQLALSTDAGLLSLTGQGQWQRGRLRFRGVAAPAPDASEAERAALIGLLSALGPMADGKSQFGTPP